MGAFFVRVLAATAQLCASYLAFAREIRTLKGVRPADLKKLEKDLEETHRSAREGLAQFLAIPLDRVHLAVMDAEGLDADIVDCVRRSMPSDPSALAHLSRRWNASLECLGQV